MIVLAKMLSADLRKSWFLICVIFTEISVLGKLQEKEIISVAVNG